MNNLIEQLNSNKVSKKPVKATPFVIPNKINRPNLKLVDSQNSSSSVFHSSGKQQQEIIFASSSKSSGKNKLPRVYIELPRSFGLSESSISGYNDQVFVPAFGASGSEEVKEESDEEREDEVEDKQLSLISATLRFLK